MLKVGGYIDFTQIPLTLAFGMPKLARLHTNPADVGVWHAETREGGRVLPENRIASHKRMRQLNPTFAVGRGVAKEIRLAAIANLRAFRISYSEALLKWRAGDRSVFFPAGTYAMRVMHGANVPT